MLVGRVGQGVLQHNRWEVSSVLLRNKGGRPFFGDGLLHCSVTVMTFHVPNEINSVFFRVNVLRGSRGGAILAVRLFRVDRLAIRTARAKRVDV